jgi:hypothetical protein
MTRRSVPVVTAAAALLWTAAVLAGVGAQAAAPVRVVVRGGPVHATWYVPVVAAAPSPARLSDRRLQVPPRPVRANRSLIRPPLAERSRWSTPAKPVVTPGASTRSPSGRTTHSVTASAASSSIPTGSGSTMTDLQRAEALPYPWRGIVRCESLRDESWRVGSSSRARGFFQFLRSTWRSLGLTGDPAAAPFSVQYSAARQLAARDGLGAWDCARILGLA